jgi:hypothetical protein
MPASISDCGGGGLPRRTDRTGKVNEVDPAWLADVLARIADHPASGFHELLSWNWHSQHAEPVATQTPTPSNLRPMVTIVSA